MRPRFPANSVPVLEEDPCLSFVHLSLIGLTPRRLTTILHPFCVENHRLISVHLELCNNLTSVEVFGLYPSRSCVSCQCCRYSAEKCPPLTKTFRNQALWAASLRKITCATFIMRFSSPIVHRIQNLLPQIMSIESYHCIFCYTFFPHIMKMNSLLWSVINNQRSKLIVYSEYIFFGNKEIMRQLWARNIPTRGVWPSYTVQSLSSCLL